jgi:hypothetical protein
LRGAVQAAQNAARLAVFGQVPEDEPAGWYSSEILDVADVRAVHGGRRARVRDVGRGAALLLVRWLQ